MKSNASAPSRATWTRLARLCCLRLCSANSTSLGLSSRSRISMVWSGMGRLSLQRKVKRGAAVGLRIGPDTPAMAVDDALRDREAHSSACIVLGTMQPLEHPKEFVGVAHVEADAVVAHKVDRLPALLAPPHSDAGHVPVGGKFEGVGQQVDEDLLQQGGVGLAGREIVKDDVHTPPLLVRAQLRERLVDEGAGSHPLGGERLAAQARKGEQIVDQATHLLRVVTHEVEVPLGVRGELRRVLLQQDAREAIDGAQGRAQVMGDGVAESLEFLIGGGEVGGAACQLRRLPEQL